MRCPWIVTSEARDELLSLRSTDPDVSLLASGPVPESCAPLLRCRFEGVDTRHGPIVLAIRASAHSELPDMVELGLVLDDSELTFVPLWPNAASFDDGTNLGPTYVLAPWSCDAGIALFVSPRLPEAHVEDPPVELRAREGMVRREGDELVIEHVPRERCRRIAMWLP